MEGHYFPVACVCALGVQLCDPIGSRRLGGESNREIVFVSFVRACERSCVWPRDDVASVAGLRKVAAWSGVVSPVPRALPFAVAKPLPCFMLACVIAARKCLEPSPVCIGRSRCVPAAFPLLPVAFRLHEMQIYASGPPVSFVRLVC